MSDVELQPKVRPLTRDDLAGVVRIDAMHRGRREEAYWRGVFEQFVGPDRRPGSIGLAVDGSGGLVGYLLGDVRQVEFGSEACGWVFAVGVDAALLRHGIARALLAEAAACFREQGLSVVRTMVRRNDVPMLAFFRRGGFVGGSYAQLELDLERTS